MIPFYTSLDDYIAIHQDDRWLELMGLKDPRKDDENLNKKES